ncbi:MAG: Re/Si-specific NAD(P)(+) transhydrogenase subunit alpha [Thermoanaerobaculales bacterium]|jgi:NAD(P) transhydrogenase subunit alpha|nr:Re/Si-specific NAD(P)(+) transhydrogenase subunit alpha [Thermoanaerobaculales bacterium]
MIVGVVKETFPGEARVALVPVGVQQLVRAGLEVLVEPGAGEGAGYEDAGYVERGAALAADRADVWRRADLVLQVRTLGANPEAGASDLALTRSGQAVVGICEPLTEHAATDALAATGATLFSMELMPRITRAQSMDILSSMATIAGYKAVLLAADALPKMFPMMMTAAGTLAAARVFVVGAGVAGLQAIASARRLGAVVQAYDVRPAVREQVESLGGKFLELELDTRSAEDAGGYAKELGDDFYAKQRAMMLAVVAENDVVITTAAIPGKKAPVLVTREMVEGMRRGSVVVDLAAERGGNCELTVPGERVEHRGVAILGPLNIPATVPFHASQMYSKNVTTFLLHLVKDGELVVDLEDEITRGTLVARGGSVVNPRVLEARGPAGQGSEGR